jgi:hypothetical protein
MNYKEKAEEIFNKFLKFQVLTIGFDNDINSEFTRRQRAKQCALICVDEIMNLGLLYGDAPFGDGGKQFHSYWQQVKTEIEKL